MASVPTPCPRDPSAKARFFTSTASPSWMSRSTPMSTSPSRIANSVPRSRYDPTTASDSSARRRSGSSRRRSSGTSSKVMFIRASEDRQTGLDQLHLVGGEDPTGCGCVRPDLFGRRRARDDGCHGRVREEPAECELEDGVASIDSEPIEGLQASEGAVREQLLRPSRAGKPRAFGHHAGAVLAGKQTEMELVETGLPIL